MLRWKNITLLGAFSFLLSLVILVAKHIPYDRDMYLKWPKMQFIPFAAGDLFRLLFMWIIIAAVLIGISLLLKKIAWQQLFFTEAKEVSVWRTFAVSCVLFLVVWGLLFMVYLPATGFIDSYIIMQNGVNMSRQHPWFYNLMLWGFGRVGSKFFDNISIGLIFYSIAQMHFMAVSVAGVTVWMRYRKIKTWVIWCVRLFYIIFPVFGLYSFTAIKDTIFAVFFLLFIPLIFEMVHSQGTVWCNRIYQLSYMFCCAGLVLFRNNGLYIIIVMTLLFTVSFRRAWKRILITTLIPVAIFSFAPSMGLKAMGKEPFFQEAVAIPLQQMTSVVAYGGEMTEDQKEFLNTLLPLDQMKERYAPMNADLIKWADNFNRDFLQEHKGEFLKHWFGMLIPNFRLYVEAYLMQTYTFWSPIPVIAHEVGYTSVLNREDYGLKPVSVLPGETIETVRKYVDAHNKFLCPGAMFWLMIAGVVALWICRKEKYIFVFVPFVLLWGTLMISVPVAESFRYLLAVGISLPALFIAVILAICDGKEKTDENSCTDPVL